MKVIYEPRGKAREYSPLAVNLYKGCGHKCSYCYVPNFTYQDRKEFNAGAIERNNIIKELERDAKQIAYSDKQVFMSFTTDPYNPVNDKLKLTKKALEIFLNYKIPVSILTKSGLRALQDLEIIKKFDEHIKIGTSLTYDNDYDSQRIEGGAANPSERLLMLKTFHDNGIKTWVSFEPIMQPEQMLNLLNEALNYVDEFQFGLLSDDKREFDWNYYVDIICKTLRPINKKFYIKRTLREKSNKIKLFQEEIDIDYLTLKPFPRKLYLEFNYESI